MRSIKNLLNSVLFAVLISLCCSSPSGPGAGGARTETVVDENGQTIHLIIDGTGKKWDVTHAKNHYNMQPQKFQFGLGPFAIRPILNPQHLSPGDQGYPGDGEEFLILGTSLEEESRAYSILKLARNEIAIEKFGGLHVAVAY